ncbi:MAG: hypothetical protein LBS90_06255 [Oscillospiraceae bacterium]|nr:hypothetical protein [Oscillospiraceae bacterium]
MPGSDNIALTLENVYDEYFFSVYEGYRGGEYLEEYTFFFAETGALTCGETAVGNLERGSADDKFMNSYEFESGARYSFGTEYSEFGTRGEFGTTLYSFEFYLYSDGMPNAWGDEREGTTLTARFTFVCAGSAVLRDYYREYRPGGELRPVSEFAVR